MWEESSGRGCLSKVGHYYTYKNILICELNVMF